MATIAPRTRDDRVLAYTRALSVAIVPFLAVGFVVLYIFPGDTQHVWAWTIASHMTSMVLASAYLGGVYFFVRAAKAQLWSSLKTGFLCVALFASLLGIATIVDWETFNHRHVAFWLWTGLYFTTPFLVFGGWLANQRFAAPADADERRLGGVARSIIGLVGLLALVQGLVMFVAPGEVIGIWPWALTPLSCRVLGAVFCLGSAGAVVLVDPRWSTVRLMLQVEALMIALMLVGSVRARAEFYTGRPVTWLMLVGFVAVLLGSGYLWYAEEIRPQHPSA